VGKADIEDPRIDVRLRAQSGHAVMSVFTSKGDIVEHLSHVRLVPKADNGFMRSGNSFAALTANARIRAKPKR
jgi:hypothetical protein